MTRGQELDDALAWLFEVEEQLQLVQAQLSQHLQDHQREPEGVTALARDAEPVPRSIPQEAGLDPPEKSRRDAAMGFRV